MNGNGINPTENDREKYAAECRNRSKSWLTLQRRYAQKETTFGAEPARTSERLIFGDFRTSKVQRQYCNPGQQRQLNPSADRIAVLLNRQRRSNDSDLCIDGNVEKPAHSRVESCHVKVNRRDEGNFYALFTSKMGNEQSADPRLAGGGGKQLLRSNSLRERVDSSSSDTPDIGARNAIKNQAGSGFRSRLKRSNTVNESATLLKAYRDRLFSSPQTHRSTTIASGLRANNTRSTNHPRRQMLTSDSSDDSKSGSQHVPPPQQQQQQQKRKGWLSSDKSPSERTPRSERKHQRTIRKEDISQPVENFLECEEDGACYVNGIRLKEVHSIREERLAERRIVSDRNRKASSDSYSDMDETDSVARVYHKQNSVSDNGSILSADDNADRQSTSANEQSVSTDNEDQNGGNETQPVSSDTEILIQTEPKLSSSPDSSIFGSTQRLNIARSASLNIPHRPERTESTASSDMSVSPTDLAAMSATADRGRRSSDSTLLKEEHIRRSEQFTELIRQYQQRGNVASKLSPYGLGVLGSIAETRSGTVPDSPKPRRMHNKEYFDVWLKNQSERISLLQDVLDGDNEKLQQLRHIILESPLEVSNPGLLPSRASSLRLPRRILPELSDDDKCPSDSETSTLTRRGVLRKHKREADPIPTREELGSQHVSAGSKKEAIVFSKSNTSSITKGANVAVVKPMPQSPEVEELRLSAETDVSQADKRKSQNSIAHGHANSILEPAVKTLNSKEAHSLKSSFTTEQRKPKPPPLKVKPRPPTVKKRPPQHTGCTVSQSRSGENTSPIAVSYKVSAFEYEPETVVDSLQGAPAAKSHPHTDAVARMSIIEEEQDGSSNMVAGCHDDSEDIAVQTKEADGSVQRINDSLSKLMGDLQGLRSQDIDLAKQLIKLGKSIKKFRENRAENIAAAAELGYDYEFYEDVNEDV